MGIEAAYIMPHPPLAVDGVGNESDKNIIQKTLSSYEHIAKEIASISPDTIIVSSPHSVLYSDYFHISPGHGTNGDFGAFGSDVSISVDYDADFVDDLCRFCADSRFPAGTEGEMEPALDHGTMVPLFFINKYYTDYNLVRISLSGLGLNDHYTFGKFIKKVSDVSNKKIVFIASGDLSHYQKEDGPYGYRPEGPKYDDMLMETLRKGDLSELLSFDSHFLNRAGECGHRSFCIMAGAIYDEELDIQVLSHEAPFGVGYGFASFRNKKKNQNFSSFLWEAAMLMELERYHAAGTSRFTAQMEAAIMESQDKDKYVLLARRTINSLILGEELPDENEEELPTEMKNTRAGSFVSIHKNGDLRGCIGTILATRKSLAAEIIANAVSAATRDPRFPKITAEELPFLEINVDVLSEPEIVAGPDDLDAKKYGVIVQNGNRLGVLLPDLEGVDTVDEQISIAKRKAGIGENETVELLRFSVERHI